MITHLKRCKERKKVANMARQLKSVVKPPEGVSLENWRFNQEVSRRELTRMITLHGLPLALVDYDVFRRFVSSLNPIFKVVSRKTITVDCVKIFQVQNKIFKMFSKVPIVGSL
jgi:predicted transcriptional regulator